MVISRTLQKKKSTWPVSDTCRSRYYLLTRCFPDWYQSFLAIPPVLQRSCDCCVLQSVSKIDYRGIPSQIFSSFDLHYVSRWLFTLLISLLRGFFKKINRFGGWLRVRHG